MQTKQSTSALIHHWPITLVSSLLFPLLLSLGFWQLSRAKEKAELSAIINARLSSQPILIDGRTIELQKYLPVRLSGYYTSDYFFLDNRTRDGRVGYEVLQVFVSDGNRWLINRGWIPAPQQREQLPTITWPKTSTVITGYLYPVETDKSKLQSQVGKRIQQLNRAVSHSLDLLYPDWSIRLSADSDTALVTDWQLLNSPPERHRAYAVQWFAMAAALVILWLLTATNLRLRIKTPGLDSR